MNSLRRELLGEQLPAIRMVVPAGWVVVPVDESGVAEFVDTIRARSREAGRPDIEAAFASSVSRWLTELRLQGGRCAVLPLDPPEGTAIPLSFAVSIIEGAAGNGLEEWVTAKIRAGGTSFLDDRRTVLSWRTSTAGSGAMDGTVTDHYHYLIPVPGTQRKAAARLAGSHVLDAEGLTVGDPRREAAAALFDAMALTVDWPPAAR